MAPSHVDCPLSGKASAVLAVAFLVVVGSFAQELSDGIGGEGQMCDMQKAVNLPSCPSADDPRASKSPVCGTDNRTYPSRCHLERAAAAAKACSGVAAAGGAGGDAGRNIPGMGPMSQPLTVMHRGRCKAGGGGGGGPRSVKRTIVADEAARPAAAAASAAGNESKKRGRGRQMAAREKPCWSDLAYARSILHQLEQQEMQRQQSGSGRGRLRAGKERRRQGQQSSGSLFLPVCLDDGNYAPVQCHADTGYCWCVTPDGRPFPDTSVRGGKPKCGRGGGKSNTRRSSSAGGRARKTRKGCGRVDRTTFNTNLIKIFRTEYHRLPSKPASQLPIGSSEEGGEGAGLSEGDRRVLDWKFSSLDSDGDGALSKAEYRDLRRLVRKVVRPKRCARTFARSCDLDKDTMISRPEWGACVGLDFNSLQGSEPTLMVNGSRDDSLGAADEGEENNCLSDRQAVLEEQNSSMNKYYIPECAPDGRYQKVQCYKSAGYCWCVHEDTGKPIPGTSKKDQDPKCDSIPVPFRPMKGCPEQRKKIFLRDLMDFLTKKMMLANSKNGSGTSAGEGRVYNSVEEEVASWNFGILDKNKNKVLERKEWKAIRTLVSTNRALKRCGKKLPRYCDVNNDRRISRTEWLECLNASSSAVGKSAGGQQQDPIVVDTAVEGTVAAALNSSQASPPASPNSRRKGPNPLDMLLIGDD
ncbi:SPARC-related modular calcium-binding protein 2 isoform X2 [Ischnura elegans]|uniref:SPARC-related modular calcium-binding protein 2 isoform X2 n=1 Tax=Ischnura elegans TaxID=197161 RepID=UPI001ED88F7B|nr:SPARC-related modular calcium-binding protein 2 isoform X2 [Ischnura elegans]